jgi:hypothetical protein
MTSRKVANNFHENRQGSSHLWEYSENRNWQDPFRRAPEAIGERFLKISIGQYDSFKY